MALFQDLTKALHTTATGTYLDSRSELKSPLERQKLADCIIEYLLAGNLSKKYGYIAVHLIFVACYPILFIILIFSFTYFLILKYFRLISDDFEHICDEIVKRWPDESKVCFM